MSKKRKIGYGDIYARQSRDRNVNRKHKRFIESLSNSNKLKKQTEMERVTHHEKEMRERENMFRTAFSGANKPSKKDLSNSMKFARKKETIGTYGRKKGKKVSLKGRKKWGRKNSRNFNSPNSQARKREIHQEIINNLKKMNPDELQTVLDFIKSQNFQSLRKKKFKNLSSSRRRIKEETFEEEKDDGIDLNSSLEIIKMNSLKILEFNTLRIRIKSNWGHKEEIGFNGIEIFDQNSVFKIIKENVTLRGYSNFVNEALSKDPSQENQFSKFNILSILNKENPGSANEGFWCVTLGDVSFFNLEIIFKIPKFQKIKGIRFWNYNVEEETNFDINEQQDEEMQPTNRGIKDVMIILENKKIWEGEIKKYSSQDQFHTIEIEKISNEPTFAPKSMPKETIKSQHLRSSGGFRMEKEQTTSISNEMNFPKKEILEIEKKEELNGSILTPTEENQIPKNNLTNKSINFELEQSRLSFSEDFEPETEEIDGPVQENSLRTSLNNSGSPVWLKKSNITENRTLKETNIISPSKTKEILEQRNRNWSGERKISSVRPSSRRKRFLQSIKHQPIAKDIDPNDSVNLNLMMEKSFSSLFNTQHPNPNKEKRFNQSDYELQTNISVNDSTFFPHPGKSNLLSRGKQQFGNTLDHKKENLEDTFHISPIKKREIHEENEKRKKIGPENSLLFEFQKQNRKKWNLPNDVNDSFELGRVDFSRDFSKIK